MPLANHSLLGFAGVSAIGGASVNFAMLVTARAPVLALDALRQAPPYPRDAAALLSSAPAPGPGAGADHRADQNRRIRCLIRTSEIRACH